MKKNICIVIPCYNEEKRLWLSAYENFLQLNPEALICFVNDGSSDNTLYILETLQTKFTDNIVILSNPKNLGKAESIRNGMRFCNENPDANFIAYLDADLSTSLEECSSLTTYLKDSITFVFGSRIMKIGSVIERRQYRFFTGRWVDIGKSKVKMSYFLRLWIDLYLIHRLCKKESEMPSKNLKSPL
mgnify:CR=1 FL=1